MVLTNSFLESAINEPLCLQPYDPAWPRKYAKEKARLLAIFAGDILQLEHIGSTAVPGLAAKPIIDMLAGVQSMEDADALLAPLRDYGYVTPPDCNLGLVDRRWLLRHASARRTHHLHLVVLGGYGWRRTLRFRDLLCAHAEAAKQYEELKLRLVQVAGSDRTGYALAKTEFVQDLLDRYPESRDGRV